MKLTTRLYLMTKLSMSGAMTLFSLYALMVWVAKNLYS